MMMAFLPLAYTLAANIVFEKEVHYPWSSSYPYIKWVS